MTPQERQLVDELFERLAQLENAPRDREAARAITEGLQRAPNAIYPLVQTVLVQDEALKRADARIRELSGEEEAPQQGGFLDTMRNAFMGRAATSVPSVRAGGGPDSRWNTGGAFANTNTAPNAAAAPQGGSFGGGSFLGTAAASAAGVIGGALLLNSISSMFGHGNSGSAFASTPSSGGSPWDNSAAGSDLSRDAGLNDIGRGAGGGERSAGLFGGDTDDSESGDDFGGDPGGDFGGDFGGDPGGDSA